MKQLAAIQLIENPDKLSSIPKRLKAPSPKFFRNLGNILLGIGGAAGATLGLFATAGVVLPVGVTIALLTGTSIGFFGKVMAGLPVDWGKVNEDANTDPAQTQER